MADPRQAQAGVAPAERGRWSDAPLPGVRCLACGKRIADEADVKVGRVVIRCRFCHRRNIFEGKERGLLSE